MRFNAILIGFLLMPKPAWCIVCSVADYLNGVCTTPESVAILVSSIDLSTVTTAINGKLSTTAGISPTLIDLSTVTTALNGKIATGGLAGTATALAAAGTLAASGDLCRGVDASGNCVRSATDATAAGVSGSTLAWSSGAAFTGLALQAKLAGATFTGASGITNVAFTATGANGNIISASSITTTGGVFGRSVSISSSPTSNFPARYLGMYTSTQLGLLSANPGDLAVNITRTQLCISSATSAALTGAWISISTSTIYTKKPCYP